MLTKNHPKTTHKNVPSETNVINQPKYRKIPISPSSPQLLWTISSRLSQNHHHHGSPWVVFVAQYLCLEFQVSRLSTSTAVSGEPKRLLRNKGLLCGLLKGNQVIDFHLNQPLIFFLGYVSFWGDGAEKKKMLVLKTTGEHSNIPKNGWYCCKKDIRLPSLP